MKLREFLNEFELDYAQAYVREKGTSFAHLKNCLIAVAGAGDSTFVRSIVYALLGANDLKNLNMRVVLVPYEEADADLYGNLVQVREDFSILQAEELEQADYIICTGYSNQTLPPFETMFLKEYPILDGLMKRAADMEKLRRFVFLSDYRIFGTANSSMVLYEYEKGKEAFTHTHNMPAMFLQSLESLCACYMRQYKKEYNILRLAQAYGACVDFSQDNLLSWMADQAAGQEEAFVHAGSAEYSFVYINDIIQAVYKAMEPSVDFNKVYHVTGPDEAVTLDTLVCRIRKELKDFPVKADYREGREFAGIPMGCAKFKREGYKPLISVEDGMIMLIKSRMSTEDVFIFDHSYQGKLDRVHEILLAYLLEVDRICKKHNLKYFLAGGTLLGAIRHHGFIPWDDDADVMMLREDYDKFCEIVQQELPSNLFFQTRETDPDNHQPFSKIRINNTLFATEFTALFPKMHNGIFMDVLAHDKTAKHKWSQKIHLSATMLFRSLVLNKWRGTPVKSGGKHPLLCKGITLLTKIVPLGFAKSAMFWLITLFKNSKSGYLYDSMGRNIGRGVFPKEWLDEVVYVDFEGYQLPVPKEYHKYLTWLYGDYMQMIPVSERRTSHSIVMMDLGEYSDFHLPPLG